MAEEIERLLVRVEANAEAFERQIKKINRALYGSQAETRKTLNAIQRDTEAASKRMFAPMGDAFRQEIAGMAASAAALFTTQQIIKYADDWTSARNALAAAGVATSDLAERQQQLVDLANETRTSTASTVELYSRLTRATSELGLTQADVLRLTELLNKSFASSGLSTQEAASAALQLSQALASGQLQGDELRSLRENAPAVAQAIADAMGVGIGALKDLGAEGKLTAKVVSSAILGSADDIESRFGSTTATVGQALTVLNNQLGAYIGQGDQSLSLTQRLAQAIIALANNSDTIVPILGTLVALIGVRYAGAMTVSAVQTAIATANNIAYQAALIRLQARQTGATAAQIALNAAMAANPIGLVLTVVAALAAGLYLLATRYNTTAIAARELNEVVGAADSALEDYRKAVDAAKNASAAERVELEKKAQALRNVTLARINDAKVAAQKQIDEAVAARRRADQSIGSSADARSRALANPTNSTAALSAGASSQARANISLAARAREEANTAIQAYERLKGAMEEIENPRPAGGGDSGGASGSSGGTGVAGGDRIAELRERLALEEDLARVRATGDESAIQREEERQRIIEATERYREAGYADAEQRAINLIAAENQAEDIAKERERTQARIREGQEREAELKRATADWTERQHSAELEIARLRGDESAIRRLEREAALRKRIAEYVERYGTAGVGLAVAEQLRFDQAAAEGDMNYAAENAARTFVDVIAAENPGEALGYAFKRAAFENLETLFANIFKSLMNNDKGGGFLNSIASGVGSFFSGGARATGGPVTAGRAYKINHNNPQSEWFVPGVGGSVLTNGQMRGLQTGSVLTSGGVLAVTVDVSGANGDAAVAAIAEAAARRGAEAAVAQSRADQAQANAAKRYRLK
ncbi:tape measure protein [Brevundimonas aurantiaca]|jgi:tape measure domain-containing protein|uniref:tape measure protein n=1 Tax=Brevundimonas aurantiaca TaxID=74316 RepID=UPI001D190D83|nr:tape measure protein [Brevundimonas aurantiaca]MCC4295857.1 tape measure protein [Brevundimonas aurantiaca]